MILDRYFAKSAVNTWCFLSWLYDTRAEIAAVNEAMSDNRWRGPARRNGCHEPCDNWNGPCVCGAWHKDGR